VLTISALSNIDGGLSAVWLVGHAYGKFHYFDFSLNLDKVDNFWAMMVGNTILSFQSMSTDQAILQKYFTTKSKRETSKSLLFYGAVVIPLIYFLSLLGVVLFVFYQQHPLMLASLKNPDAVVAHYAAMMLPHGLAGLVVVSIFAGSMSTVSGSLNALATSSVVDIYKRLIQKNRSDGHYTRASRVATFLWGALATVGAFYAGRLGALILAYHKICSLVGGILLGVFLLGILSRRTGSRGVLIGAIAGLGIVIYVFETTTVSLYWYCAIGLLATMVMGWLFSLMLPEETPKFDLNNGH
jgi:Na+/proline symporter